MSSLKKFETFTSCCLINNTNKIFLGTNFGRIYRGTLLEKRKILQMDFGRANYVKVLESTLERIYSKLAGEIRAIKHLGYNKYLILSSEGEILWYNLDTDKKFFICNEKGSAKTRKWRLLVLDFKNFLTIGNYRRIIHWSRDSWGRYNPKFLSQNGEGLFCLDWIKRDQNLLFINGYHGTSEMWVKKRNNVIKSLDLDLDPNLQQITEIIENHIFSIDYFGNFIFYSVTDDYKLNTAERFDIANKKGNCVHHSAENEMILAGTEDNLLYYDFQSDTIFTLNLQTRDIIDYKGIDICLSAKSIIRPDFSKKKTPSNLTKYNYIKIGLVGDSYVGKTCLCRFLESGVFHSTPSSSGHHVWVIPFNEDQTKRILFYDLAGQGSELFTYFPLIADVNIIFLFYRANSKETFDIVLEYHDELRKKHPNVEFIFIQTFSKQRLRVPKPYLEEELQKRGFNHETDVIRIDSSDGTGYPDFEVNVLNSIDWSNTRSVTRTNLKDLIEKVIQTALSEGKAKTFTVEELAKIIGATNTRTENVVKNFAKQGLLIYLAEEKLIVVNDEDYHEIHSDIATAVDARNGYMQTNDIIEEIGSTDTKKEKYVKHILDYYKKNHLTVFFAEDTEFESLIFPRQLKQETINFNTDIPKVGYFLKYRNVEITIQPLINFLGGYLAKILFLNANEIMVQLMNTNCLIRVIIDQKTDLSDPSLKTSGIYVDKRKMSDLTVEEDLMDYMLDRITQDNMVDFSSNEISDISEKEHLEIIKLLLKRPFERPYLDFKKELTLSDTKRVAELLKDSIALSNSAYMNENRSYMVVGLEEVDNGLKVNSIGNYTILEQQIIQKLNEYINVNVQMEFIPININLLYKWHKDGDISSCIQFNDLEIDISKNEVILIIAFVRSPHQVYEISKKFSFEEVRGTQRQSKEYNVGNSWIRFSSHTYLMTESYRKILREA